MPEGSQPDPMTLDERQVTKSHHETETRHVLWPEKNSHAGLTLSDHSEFLQYT